MTDIVKSTKVVSTIFKKSSKIPAQAEVTLADHGVQLNEEKANETEHCNK